MAICKPGPGRVDQSGLAYQGSMLQMQLYVNRHSDYLNHRILEGLETQGEIKWRSPLEGEGFAEYRDTDFLERLGLGELVQTLGSFWPKRGPCWDGLATYINGSLSQSPVLVEAKSYPDEALSTLKATSTSSLEQIRAALAATASWLGLHSLPASWTETRYQTANRLARIYFLREICGIDARLVFLHIVGDPTRNSTTAREWADAWAATLDDLEIAEPSSVAPVLVPGLERPTEFPL